MLRLIFVLLVGVHALLHLIGPASAFGWLSSTPLRMPVSPPAGVAWLAAALLLLAAAAAFAAAAPQWWWPALPGLLLSQWLIIGAWQDARVGTLANLVIAVPLLLALIDARPSSFRSRFAHDRAALLARPAPATPIVVDADLMALPPLYRAYLRRVGAVGRPRIRNMRVTFDARMRGSASAPWMPAVATQYEFFDGPARLFYMNATRGGMPIDIYHRYVDGAATFQVRIASLWPMVNKAGPVLTGAETVTLMNDIVVMAPAAVLDLPFTWQTTGPHTVLATFSNAGFTVAATLTFDSSGDLVGFLSNDRTQEEAGASRSLPWSTPISAYREIDGVRIGSRGDAMWVEPGGAWTYGEFTIRSIAYNVSR